MRRGRLTAALTAFAVSAAVLMVLGGAGVAAVMPERPAPAFTAPTLLSAGSINAYLRSIGVDPSSVVVQRGARNYVGPNCPGTAWRCTVAARVVQIGAVGARNVAECETPCVIVQTGTTNNAECRQRGRAPAEVQSCAITQTGARNHARIHQDVHQNDGPTQSAKQTASIKQTGTESNRADIKQEVHQVVNSGAAQVQEAHQSATVEQDASGAADNWSDVDQSQHQTAHHGTTQDQNAMFSQDANCASEFPSAPNQCANVDQSSNAGRNDSKLRQSTHQDARTKADANQQQGSFNGGLEGKVHQETLTGRSSNDADQEKRQHLSGGPGSSQTQFDPLSCCGIGSQLGGIGNVEDIDQHATQNASEALAFQEIALLGQSMTPTGSCTVSQKARNNSDTGDNDASLSPCPFLQLATVCFSGGEGGGDIDSVGDGVVIQQEGEGCTEFNPITNPPECEVCVNGGVFSPSFVRPNG